MCNEAIKKELIVAFADQSNAGIREVRRTGTKLVYDESEGIDTL